MEKEILELFKAMVVDESQLSNDPVLDHVKNGLVLNFTPKANQIGALKELYKPIDVRTLFTKEERDNADPFHLITKQILHYVEVYGLGVPGLFNLEVCEGQIVSMMFVRGVTVDELGDMVRKLLYSNAPVKDSDSLKKIILEYKIDLDINQVRNNELRVGLFDVKKDVFESGDDAVRYMCFNATENLMLIKSKEVLMAVSEADIPVEFMERHKLPLAQVFNRHKNIILSAKNDKTKTVVNQIARLSKKKHVPIHSHISKRFVTEALSSPNTYDYSVLDKVSLRDKFKFLNLLAYKKERVDVDTFVIRNGKTFVKGDRKVYNVTDIETVETAILTSLGADLARLKDKNILLDDAVDYGLPISRKQTIGQLPFGTHVTIEGGDISSGMYWENAWGARDLDLSTIDVNGNRTGWGHYSGYDRNNPVTFSGDLTDARNGAMEFMTSKDQDYGLFVNIFSGEIGCEMELVVGHATKKQWIQNPIIREKHKLNSRGNIIGFVKGRSFVVFSGRLNNNRWSGMSDNSIVRRGMSDFWTVSRLFDTLGINYDTEKNEEDVEYDFEMDYAGFSYDKLEELLLD